MIEDVLALALANADAASSACRDGRTPDQAISAVYALVSTAPGQGWDWGRLADLFLGDGLFVTMTAEPSGGTATTAKLNELKMQTEAAFTASGFTEAEYRRRTHVFGDTASIYSSFHVSIPSADTPLMRGMNHFQLVRQGDSWRIVSNVSQMEGARWRLPEEWAPAMTTGER